MMRVQNIKDLKINYCTSQAYLAFPTDIVLKKHNISEKKNIGVSHLLVTSLNLENLSM